MIQILKHFLQAKWRWKTLRSKQALEQYHAKRAALMVRFAKENSGFYRQHWTQVDVNDFEQLPFTSKTLMMQYFDTFNTIGIQKEKALSIALQAEQQRTFDASLNGYTVGLSSGTSGQRGLFVLSQTEQDMWTGVVLARVLHTLKHQRIALFLRANSHLYENVGQGRWLQFRYFDLIQDHSLIYRLKQYQPTILVAPPSKLEVLAKQKESGKLTIQPQRLISVAEVLEPQDKQRLEQVFAVPVHQIYQATEGLLAISCSEGSLHIQEDLIRMEFEPLEGDFFTPIVTDLYRKTQPIIRYRLEDVVRLDARVCPCGHPWRVIKQIEGRESDVLNFYGQKIFPPMVREAIVSVLDVKDYLIVQESNHAVHIYLEVAKNFESVAAEVKSKLSTYFKSRGIHLKQLELTQGLVPSEANVKRRRILRKHDPLSG